MRAIGGPLAILLFATLLLEPVRAEPCGVPGNAGASWPVAPAADMGLDDGGLCALSEMLNSTENKGVHSVLVARHGKLVYEAYHGGFDQPWGKAAGTYAYDAETRHDLRSISKSVTSLLVGIAIDRKLIAGVDEKVFDLLPAYADLRDPDKGEIRVADLLTMTSGLLTNEVVPYEDPNNTERLMAQSADPLRFVLERRLMSKPGSTWGYSGGSTMLLAAIIEKASGRPFLDFAREALFEPLGITDVEWIALRKSGKTAAYGSLRLAPRDLARIGQLVLDNGKWQGRQIVSASWIAQSTTPRIDGWYPDSYAYHWWRGRSPLKAGGAADWIAGVGIGGQRLFILPALDLVVTINSWYPASDHRAMVMDILENHVLASLRQ